MALNDKDLHAQAAACAELAGQNQNHPFFQRYTPLLQEARDRYQVDLAAVAKAETSLRKESAEGREASAKLADRSSYWLGMMTIEMPHLDRTSLGSVPSSRGELLLFTDTLIDLIEDQGQDLYLAKEASMDLQQLVEKARTELGEADEAEHLFHVAVAEKNAAKERLASLIRTFKAGSRRIFGAGSLQYRSLRDSAIKGRGRQAGGDKAKPASGAAT